MPAKKRSSNRNRKVRAPTLAPQPPPQPQSSAPAKPPPVLNVYNMNLVLASPLTLHSALLQYLHTTKICQRVIEYCFGLILPLFFSVVFVSDSDPFAAVM
jgi:hypothetical protein